jgi:MFS transporter, CP family, cyanate transporter
MNKTHWTNVGIAFFAGCITAFQIGKAFASLALIIDELGLSLVQAGSLLSLFTLIAALAGSGFGLLADRIGHLYMAIFGLLISATGAFLGSIADDLSFLMFSRLVEGFGFIISIVALPSLMSRSASDKDRPLVMGIWAAFMPTGIGLSMIITPVLLEFHGWRGLWSDIGFIMLVWAVIIYFAFRSHRKRHTAPANSLNFINSILRMGPLLVVAGFVCYSTLYQSLTAFLPTMLVQNYAVPIDKAAHFGAIVVVGNIIGNISAGWLIGRGMAPWKVVTMAFTAMLICASMVFATMTDPVTKVIAGFLFSAFGGLFPGTAFVLASRFSPSPSHMALMTGLILQGAGIGQTMGPMMVSSVVEYNDNWNYAILVVALMGTIGLSCAWQLSKTKEASNN